MIKWSANKEAKIVFSSLENDLLAASIRDLDLQAGDASLPLAGALGCVSSALRDKLLIDCLLEPLNRYTRGTMLGQLGQSFNPLGFGAPFFMKACLILQQLAVDGFDWDADVPGDVVGEWSEWLYSLLLLEEFLMNRWYFLHCGPLKSVDVVNYQLHGFSDASNQAYSVVIYLRRLVNGLPTVSFVLGKCTVVQRHQSSYNCKEEVSRRTKCY